MTNATTTSIKLPRPNQNAPMLSRVISEAIRKNMEPIVWVIGEKHPIAPDFKVVRMFLEESVGVWIYAAGDEGLTIDYIPDSRVLVANSMATVPVFLAALEEEESDEEDEDEPIEPGDGIVVPPTPATTPNGQPAS